MALAYNPPAIQQLTSYHSPIHLTTDMFDRERDNLFQGSYNPFNDGAVGRPSALDDHFEMSSHTRTIKLSGRPPVSETRLARSSKGVKESIIKRFNGGRVRNHFV